MPYTITTRDGITIKNIPDDIPPDAEVVKQRVASIRQQRAPSEIPGVDPEWAAGKAPAQNAKEPSLGDNVVGAGEAALTTLTGLTGGAVGLAGGALAGAADAVRSGTFGTAQGANAIERSAMQGAQALTYAPRTPSGQAQAHAVGEVMQQALPAMPLTGELAALGRATPPAMRAIGDTAAATLDKARTGMAAIPAKVQGVLRNGEPTPGTMGSVGSAGTDAARQRVATAESLPVPVKLSKGQATRAQEQLRFEGETAKDPNVGGALREFAAEQNERLAKNFDAFVDMSGAEAVDLIGAGRKVTGAIAQKAARDKAEIRVAYKAAEKAGELEQPVTLTNLVDHLNESAPDAATAPLLTTARARALQLGVAVEENGQLVAQPVPLKIAETYRQAVNRATNFEPTNMRQSALIREAVDAGTETAAGTLYQQARALRRRYAQQYENHALIADLISNRKGMADRKVALEDVFKRSVIQGSRADLGYLRRVLQTGGEEGHQAWREIQGATVRHIRDQALSNATTDIRGNPIVSHAKLNAAIKALDADGKLDFIFGKKGAQQMRDLGELATVVYSQPPGTVNTSNTASVLLQALTEAGVTGSLTGLPVPVLSGLKMLTKYAKDQRIRQRVAEALRYAEAREQATKTKPLPRTKAGETVH